MYTGNTYMLLFFIYGLAFFCMGISAFQQRTLKDSNLPLLRAIKQLGYFGIIHGLVEWILMVLIWNEYPQYSIQLFIVSTFLNTLSFVFLWMFGINLFEDEVIIKKYFMKIPLLIFTFWIAAFLLLLSSMDNYIETLKTLNVTSRYFIALPGCVIACIGLYKSGKTIYALKLKRISIKFKVLAVLFGLYGIFAGLIVSKHHFFPANIINEESFIQLLGFPVEIARTVVAIAITILFINVINIFMWEAEYKIEKLSKQQLIWQERRNLGHELHDRVIQNIFAAGLAIENLIEDKDDKELDKLINIKNLLNLVIDEIRGFISKSSIEKFNINEFKNKLIELIDKLENVSNLTIVLDYKVPEMTLGHISSERLVQIYYIIQEAVSNSIKHSQGSEVKIDIKSNLKSLIVSISDNGQGIYMKDIDVFKHYGLAAMKERAISINGDFNINSSSAGVLVILVVPWEGINYEE
ncbi:hypothetical protein GC105_03925 [Alkalibaculum sp. M08DMB]|uniref:histidine kinase n=1 Tax=Alkalibaculum sporogenes TaxID=2655001 RepID=A0A6A7K6E1_9FIRM|nr:ATP-binding protein [Alkalibaculum sporogenes]MPW24935.1 hypothetical protein [Alkalibaculum sporogenes]